MKVAVWDTYVKSNKGDVLHFDIIAPEEIKDPSTIYTFGREYLESINESSGQINTSECQFCHIEEPTEEMLASIEQSGYFILEMEKIPALLPPNPNRRDMIMHLKAHFPEQRFKSFAGKTEEEVRSILSQQISD